MDISTIATGVEYDDRGLWVGKNRRGVSYPAEGNDACFAVENDSFWFGHRNDVITHLVRRFSPTRTFFDIGGGNGCVSHALQSAGIETVLVEPGPVGAINAKTRGVHTVIHASFENAGFAPGSLPSAGLFDVLEHIESDAAFLRTIHDCLAPKGYLYLTVPAHRFLWSADDVHAGHFRRYTTTSLNNLLSETGFDVRYSSYFFSFLVLPIFFMRSLPNALGCRTSVSPATIRRDHSTRSRIVSPLVRTFRNLELGRIANLKRIPMGSSCIAVATKAG